MSIINNEKGKKIQNKMVSIKKNNLFVIINNKIIKLFKMNYLSINDIINFIWDMSF